MGDFKVRLSNARDILFRRGSAASTASISLSEERPRTRKKASNTQLNAQATPAAEAKRRRNTLEASQIEERNTFERNTAPDYAPAPLIQADLNSSSDYPCIPPSPRSPTQPSAFNLPAVTLDTPTPDVVDVKVTGMVPSRTEFQRGQPTPLPSWQHLPTSARPVNTRSQSLVLDSSARQKGLLLLSRQDSGASELHDHFPGGPPAIESTMAPRKIWVKRSGQAATLVQIQEQDLVDDVKDMILRKYANSLGRVYDSPDVTLRIVPRELSQQASARTLGPEEELWKTLDAYFPGGQSVDEALIIEVPQRRTPRPSPRTIYSHHVPYYLDEHNRPVENGTDYFPPMPAALPSPNPPPSFASHESRHSTSHNQPPSHHERSISVLQTGHIPQLPSPGAIGARRPHSHLSRPKYGRQHTSSPTIITTSALHAAAHAQQGHLPPLRQGGRARLNSNASERPDMIHLPPPPPPPPPPLPTPPPPEATSTAQDTTLLIPPISSPGPSSRAEGGARRKKGKNISPDVPAAPPTGPFPNNQLSTRSPGYLPPSSVPPISVLIVEDNPINLRLLEMFVKRLRVRWQTAMNGRDAVHKWRAGGGSGAFHLVLMDLQMPVMNGLEATKEIRRLERLNGIGVFSTAPGGRKEGRKNMSRMNSGDESTGAVAEAQHGHDGNGKEEGHEEVEEVHGDDVLENRAMFKSPVIIVALTASSLQSDRHEALAAGCNDFLTKPVNFGWLERKVMEWGCMQALIDFDGWRKWMDFSKSDSTENLQALEGTEEAPEKLKPRKERKSGNVGGVGTLGVGEVSVVPDGEDAPG